MRIDRALPHSIKTLAAKAKEEERAQEFLLLCWSAGTPKPEREIRLHPVREWRHDFVWRPAVFGGERGLILESEGGLYTGGGHARGRGIENDIEKANELQLLGYLYLRVPSDRLATSETVALIVRAFKFLFTPTPPAP